MVIVLEEIQSSHDSRGKAIISQMMKGVKGKLSTSFFQKRHNDNFPFEPIPTESKDLISADGNLSIFQFVKIEAAIQVTNSHNTKEVYTKYKSRRRSGSSRWTSKKKWPPPKLMVTIMSFDDALTEDERVSCVLDCSYLSGMPTQTSDCHTVTGR